MISIVIPTFNRKDSLKVVLNSLKRQNFPSEQYEIILVDSGSTDGTAELIKEFDINNLSFIVQENKGRSGARNRGIREAKGELVLFTDADIIADENLLACHRKFYDKNKGCAVVGCEIQVNTIYEYENVKKNNSLRRTLHPDERERLSWLYFLTGNALVPREKLIEVGMFDESFTGYGHEDIELGYRIEKSGMKILYNHKAINYHWHPVEFVEQCEKMRLAGISTVRFYNKHRDYQIKLKYGMTPVSLGIHSLFSRDGWFISFCRKNRERFKICRELALQYDYISGIKEALQNGIKDK